ncbi:stage II sporulation protein R [Bacillota bacterium]
MKSKKKKAGLIALVLIAIFAYSCWLMGDRSGVLSNDDFIRFHVVANSNSGNDQRLKLAVRDGLLEIINNGLLAEAAAAAMPEQSRITLDIDRTKEFIQENLTELETEAGRILSEAGCDYPVKAELGVDFIPQKTYGNITFPAGNYNALKVIIGEGSGENWWCVLFPPLCLIGMEAENEASIEDLYKEALLDHKYTELIEATEKPKMLKLKFKVLELLAEDAL